MSVLADYLNYMSKTEGIVLSYMGVSRRETCETVEQMIDRAGQENPYFQPLLSLAPTPLKEMQIESYTKLNAVLGDTHGIINSDQKDLPIMQLFLESTPC